MDIWLTLHGSQIHYVNRILEGHEYLGVLTTFDGKSGLARIRTTEDVLKDVCAVLDHLPFDVSYGFEKPALFSGEKV